MPAVLVALFTDPISAIWVTLLFVALQQLEGHVVAPQVFRISLRINPILIILALLIGYQLYGIVGGAGGAAARRGRSARPLVYLRRHLVLEPWTLNVVGRQRAAAGGARMCRAAARRLDPRDAYCRACGASSSSGLRVSDHASDRS